MRRRRTAAAVGIPFLCICALIVFFMVPMLFDFPENEEDHGKSGRLLQITRKLAGRILNTRQAASPLPASQPLSAGQPHPSALPINVQAETIAIPLFGSNAESGTIYAELGVGSSRGDGRPQWVRAVVDTGSASFTMPCADTDQQSAPSHKPHSKFNSSLSSSLEAVPCDLLPEGVSDDAAASSTKPRKSDRGCTHCDSIGRCAFQRVFAEGSKVEGVWLRDRVGFPAYDANGDAEPLPSHHISAQFGCHTSETGLLSVAQEDGADGILGLSQGKLSMMRALVSQKAIARNVLSICLPQPQAGPPAEEHDPQGSLHRDSQASTGALVFGGALHNTHFTSADADATAGAVQHAAMKISSSSASSSMGWYVLGLTGVRVVAGKAAKSTSTRLPKSATSARSRPLGEGSTHRMLAEPPPDLKRAWADATKKKEKSKVGSGAVERDGWLSSSVGLDAVAGTQIVVDTGSSYSYLPPQAVDAIIHGIAAHCYEDERGYSHVCGYKSLKPDPDPTPGLVIPQQHRRGPDGEEYLPQGQAACYRLLSEDEGAGTLASFKPKMPMIQLRLAAAPPDDGVTAADAGASSAGRPASSAIFNIPPENYLPDVEWTRPLRCLAIQSNSHSNGRLLLGLHALAGYELTLDADRMRASWFTLPLDKDGQAPACSV